MERELQTTEHVSLIGLNTEVADTFAALHQVCKIFGALQRGQNMSALSDAVEPLDRLAMQLRRRVADDKELDPEIRLLRATSGCGLHPYRLMSVG